MEKVIFIDRDGVINVDPIGDYIKRWEDFRFEEGAIEGLQILSKAGYEIIVISNQAGVGDGVYPLSELQRINQNMIDVFRKNKIRFRSSHYCHHGKKAGCKCRKPEIGLFLEATKGLEFDKKAAYFVGDKISDMTAGKRFGIKTAFVLTGHGSLELSALKKESSQPDLICNSLKHAAEAITA